MKHLLLIDNYDSFTYNLSQILKEHGAYKIIIKKHNEINIDEIANFDKILISPGPGLPSDFPIINQLLNKYHKQKSILGICLGHQAIAEYFGAKLCILPKVFHGLIKTSKVILENDYLFQNIPNKIDVGLYHSWHVKQNPFPENLKITMKSEDDIIMAITHKKYDVKGIQFHPESIMTKYGKNILNNWLN